MLHFILDFAELFHVDFMKKVQKEIELLRPLFDNKLKGFAEFANKYIKIDYEHLLGMELKFNRFDVPKIGGFHHDYMNIVEKEGIIEFANKVINKHGVYSVDLMYGTAEIKRGKTFFPSDWSREKVINAIYEAYENFMQSGVPPLLAKNGKYELSGFTKEGIKIEMYITKNGRVTTAYPIV